MSMDKNTRDLIIDNDLGWLKDLTVHEVDGKILLGEGGENDELPMNVSHVMLEDEFIRNWMIPFALGNRLGAGYFRLNEWYKFSFNGTRAVMVVNRNPETQLLRPVLLIPPLITHNLTDEDYAKLRGAALVIHANSEDTMRKNDMNASLKVAQVLSDDAIGLKARPMSLTDLVNPAYFARHKIVPEVETNVYWIRDFIRKGQETKIEDLNKAREIFFRDHIGEPVSKDEWKFIHELSLGEFKLDEKLENAPESVAKNEAGHTQAHTPPNDPLEC